MNGRNFIPIDHIDLLKDVQFHYVYVRESKIRNLDFLVTSLYLELWRLQTGKFIFLVFEILFSLMVVNNS